MRTIKLRNEIIDYGVRLLRPEEQWKIALGEDINVAILDTGIDYNHEDLKCNVKGGINFTSPDRNDYMDKHGHGTFCAGIIGASANRQGIIGLAPKVNLFAVKVLNDTSQGTLTWLIKGLQWCIDNHMDIISMSLGFACDSWKMHNLVVQAYQQGITLIAAAGNDKEKRKHIYVDYPASYDEVICVTAVDKNSKLATFDLHGKSIELSAPGVDITSTFPYNSYALGSGTSFAAPHISGAIALLQSTTLKKYGHKLSNEEVRIFLHEHAVRLNENGSGYGLFQFY